MHVLDRVKISHLIFRKQTLIKKQVMSPLEAQNATSTSAKASPTVTTTATVSIGTTATTTATNRPSSAAGALASEPLNWRVFEALGIMYSYLFLII